MDHTGGDPGTTVRVVDGVHQGRGGQRGPGGLRQQRARRNGRDRHTKELKEAELLFLYEHNLKVCYWSVLAGRFEIPVTRMNFDEFKASLSLTRASEGNYYFTVVW